MVKTMAGTFEKRKEQNYKVTQQPTVKLALCDEVQMCTSTLRDVRLIG